MLMLCHGKSIRITGPLCGESTGKDSIHMGKNCCSYDGSLDKLVNKQLIGRLFKTPRRSDDIIVTM